MNKQYVIEQMRGVATDPELGSWTANQRAIISGWAAALSKKDEKPDAAKQPEKTFWKRASAKLYGFYKFLVATGVTVLVMAFLYFGAKFFYYSSAGGNIDQIGGTDTNAVCFQSGIGLSCLPKWLVDMPDTGKPKVMADLGQKQPAVGE